MDAAAVAGSMRRRAWDVLRGARFDVSPPLRRLLSHHDIAWRDVAARTGEAIGRELRGPIVIDPNAALLAAPFAMILGSAVYLGLLREPAGWPAIVVLVIAAAGAVWTRRRFGATWLARATALAAFGLLGFVLTDLRAAQLEGPRVPAREAPYAVEGWVERIEAATEGRRRYTVRLMSLDGVTEDLPKRVRMTAPLSPVRPGETIRARAVLSEPAGPAVPGGYDFARRAYFDEIGGSGYALGRLERADALSVQGGQAIQAWFARLRGGLADRMRLGGGEGAGGVLAALVTGDRSEIDPDTTEALRVAGLGHILAISGMHLALVGGGAFFVLSWLFAAIDPLARRCNPRKLAAAGALVIAFGYLIISGGATPTQRAFVMSAVVFGAILADRRALTLRGVGVAALIVLLLAPESGVTPGFQMSFAASIALVAFNDWRRRRAWERPQPREIGAAGAVRRFLVGLAVTSLIAGTATAPFAAYHFNRFAGLGYFANFLAMPVFTVLVMPFATIAGLLAPFGLEAAPAWVSGKGVDLVTAIAAWTASQPGAITSTPAAPPLALALTGGLFVLGAIVRRGFWLACLPVALLTLGAWRAEPRAQMWIGENGGWVARAADGGWVGEIGRGESYGAELFLRRLGAEGAEVARPGSAQAAALGFRCDARGCSGELEGLRVAIAHSWSGVLEDCARADVVLTPGDAPPRVRARCEGVVLAPRRLWDDRGRLIETANGRPLVIADAGKARPWR